MKIVTHSILHLPHLSVFPIIFYTLLINQHLSYYGYWFLCAPPCLMRMQASWVYSLSISSMTTVPRAELGHKISLIKVCIIHQIGHIYLVSVSFPKAFAITPGEVEMVKIFIWVGIFLLQAYRYLHLWMFSREFHLRCKSRWNRI